MALHPRLLLIALVACLLMFCSDHTGDVQGDITSGATTIRAAGTTLCLDAPSSSNGATLQFNTCSTAKTQTFELVPVSTTAYDVHTSWGLCVDWQYSSSSGLQVLQRTCEGPSSVGQQWLVTGTVGSQSIEAGNAKGCLEQSGSSAVTEPCGGAHQSFALSSGPLDGGIPTTDAGTKAVVADFSGSSSAELALSSLPADNVAALSSPGTSISLPNLDIAAGHDGVLAVALFAESPLTSPWCKWGAIDHGIKFTQVHSVPGSSDTLYVGTFGHGDNLVIPGKQTLYCGWGNTAMVAVGAASFLGVHTWMAQYNPTVTFNSGTSTQPYVDVPTGPSHMSMAFMMHATSVATSLTAESQTLQWAVHGGLNAAMTTASGSGASVKHQFTLGSSSSWVAVGVDLANQPFNLEQRWMGPPSATSTQAPTGVQSASLTHFVVGTGADEYLTVGITSPGSLTGLKVTWDGQSLSQIDAFAIPGDSVPVCAHVTWQTNGGSSCGTSGSPTQPYLYWYGLSAPHPGNKTLSVTWTNDISGSLEPLVDVMALSFSEVDPSLPYQHISHANGVLSGKAGPVSLGISSDAATDMTLALLGNGGGSIWCDPTRTMNAPSVGHGIDFASTRAPGAQGGGTVTHTWTHGTGPESDGQTCAAVTTPASATPYGIIGFELLHAQ